MPEIRLSKAAKELSVATSTIIDLLNSKGFNVENNPNAKLSEEMHNLLLKEFSADKTAKENANLFTKNKLGKETIVILKADETHQHPKQKKEEDQDEILIKNTGSGAVDASKKQKIAPETPHPAPVEKKEEEITKIKAETIQGPTILGKIDLPSTEKPAKKGKGSKKEKEEEEKEKEKTPAAKGKKKEVEEIKEEPAIISEEKKTEIIPPITEDPTIEKEQEIYRRNVKKLTGPTILGKIELPVEPPKHSKYAAPENKPLTEEQKKARSKRKRSNKKVNYAGGSASKTQPPKDSNQRPIVPAFTKGKKYDKKPPVVKPEVTDKDIQDQIKATLARLSGAGKSKAAKHRKQKRETASQVAIEKSAENELSKKVIQVTEFVSANELAKMMDVPVTQIISTCMSLGIFVSINQRLDAETLSIVADEFGYKVEFVTAEAQDVIEEEKDT